MIAGPAREWVLLNPGPANTTPSVRAALVMPDLCHREPECFEMVRRCRDGLVRLAGAGADWTAVLFAGSGTAAVEAAICAAVPAAGRLLVVNNGVYGDRMLRIARAHAIPAVAASGDIFAPIPVADVEAALAAHSAAGRGRQPGGAAERLLLPPALPLRDRRLQDRFPATRRNRAVRRTMARATARVRTASAVTAGLSQSPPHLPHDQLAHHSQLSAPPVWYSVTRVS